MKKVILVPLSILLIQAGCSSGTPSTSPTPLPRPTVGTSPVPTAVPTALPTTVPSAPLIPTPVATTTTSPTQTVRFTILLDRDTANESEDKLQLITSDLTFDQVWARHSSMGQPQPVINFKKNTVVSIYKLNATHAGLGYEISAITQSDRLITVHYRQRTMQPNVSYIPVITNTIQMVSFPLSQQAGDFDGLLFVAEPNQPATASPSAPSASIKP